MEPRGHSELRIQRSEFREAEAAVTCRAEYQRGSMWKRSSRNLYTFSLRFVAE